MLFFSFAKQKPAAVSDFWPLGGSITQKQKDIQASITVNVNVFISACFLKMTAAAGNSVGP